MKRGLMSKGAGLSSLFAGLCILSSAVFAEEAGSLRADEPIQPIPLKHDVNPRKVALGKRLFHETLLSGDNSLSCSSCHEISRFGVDGKKTPLGIKGQTGSMNAPTVINSRFNFAQFWDGRAENLHEQAKGPITNPIEMGSNWPEVLEKLNDRTDYVIAFREIYPDGITENNIADAIQSYEYTLNAINSPFDQYLRGDDKAIGEQEKRGYTLFKEYGCIACHQGMNVGGNLYQRMGAFLPYFSDANTDAKNDFGRYNVTKEDKDLHVFKVPSLRMVVHTAPYFHDGSVATLTEAIDIMARYQLGYQISKSENDDIQAFLRSLSGELPAGAAQ